MGNLFIRLFASTRYSHYCEPCSISSLIVQMLCYCLSQHYAWLLERVGHLVIGHFCCLAPPSSGASNSFPGWLLSSYGLPHTFNLWGKQIENDFAWKNQFKNSVGNYFLSEWPPWKNKSGFALSGICFSSAPCILVLPWLPINSVYT